MAQDEQVLVVQRSTLEQIGAFHGITFDVDRYLAGLFVPGTPCFIPRSQAEDDPAFKQIIPYVLMSCGDRFLTYVRGQRSGEQRLVGRRSIGIGGHINPIDAMPLFCDSFRDAYLGAVAREVAEEVAVSASHTEQVVALINDDSTPVGRVHLGIVHHWTLAEPNVERREQMITQLDFRSLDELQAVRDELESWSAFCLDYIARAASNRDGHLAAGSGDRR